MFRKRPYGIRVRKVLENPGHTPAAESSGCCWRQCRAAGAEAAGAGAGAAGEGQKVLDCAGEQGSAAGLAGTVAARVL